MPGKYVFPGGRVEAGTAGWLPQARWTQGRGASDGRVQRPSASRGTALALAAIRETFEETGLLLGTTEYGAPETRSEGPWGDFARHGVYPELDRLHFVARAITPPRRPKRFDTRFFAVDASAIAAKVEGVVGPESELVDFAGSSRRKH